MRWPTLVEALQGERVVQVAVGALHCLVVTDKGQVRSLPQCKSSMYGSLRDIPHHCRSLCIKPQIIVISQVYGWGDNDHGQQGNGSTTVQRKPSLVQGLHEVRVARVACGSSHSIAWASADAQSCATQEPVLFDWPRDPLGCSTLGMKNGAAPLV